MKKRIGLILFVFLLLTLTVPPWAIWAQATAGYTKIGSVAGNITTYTDTTAADGVSYNYEVTAQNAAGIETIPTNIVPETIPSTGTHSVTLNWIASAVDATHSAPASYNIYRQVILPANPPGALTGTVN